MSNAEQVKVIKEALDLEKEVDTLKQELETCPPTEPVLTKVDRVFPKAESKMKFFRYAAVFVLGTTIIGLICQSMMPNSVITRIITGLAGMSVVISIAWYFLVFKKMKARDVEKIKNSEEFKAEIRRLEAGYDKADADALAEYERRKKEYEEVLMPAYKNRVAKCETELEERNKMLETLYSTSRLIPKQYHNSEALQYLYDLMSTSEYDIKEAIKHFEEDQERLRQEVHRQNMEALEQEKAAAAWQQAESTEQMRRDQNFANTVAYVQRHNTNKHLKKMSNR